MLNARVNDEASAAEGETRDDAPPAKYWTDGGCWNFRMRWGWPLEIHNSANGGSWQKSSFDNIEETQRLLRMSFRFMTGTEVEALADRPVPASPPPETAAVPAEPVAWIVRLHDGRLTKPYSDREEAEQRAAAEELDTVILPLFLGWPALAAQLAEANRYIEVMKRSCDEWLTQYERAASRAVAAEAAIAEDLKCAFCGQGMSRNPHPDAGDPILVDQIGPQWVCIPCGVKSRKQATKLRWIAERELEAAECQLAESTRKLSDAEERIAKLAGAISDRKEAMRVMEAALKEAILNRDHLGKFKACVHDRLDKMGVPVDPDSPHKAEGCRVGGRLDWVEARLEKSRLALVLIFRRNQLMCTVRCPSQTSRQDVIDWYCSTFNYENEFMTAASVHDSLTYVPPAPAKATREGK